MTKKTSKSFGKVLQKLHYLRTFWWFGRKSQQSESISVFFHVPQRGLPLFSQWLLFRVMCDLRWIHGSMPCTVPKKQLKMDKLYLISSYSDVVVLSIVCEWISTFEFYKESHFTLKFLMCCSSLASNAKTSVRFIAVISSSLFIITNLLECCSPNVYS